MVNVNVSGGARAHVCQWDLPTAGISWQNWTALALTTACDICEVATACDSCEVGHIQYQVLQAEFISMGQKLI